MVDDMLDVSKLEAGMLGAWRRNSRVDEILEHVKVSLERKAAVKKVKLEWTIGANLPEVYCDDEKVGRVLTNLAINAIKFSGDPGLVRISVCEDAAAGDVEFSIADNGPGIDEESLSSIFRRFKQLDADPRGSTKGFGLGLNIAKALVDLNFGQMHVKSQLGKGSTFSFTVPLADPIEIMRRYLRRIESPQQAEESSPFVSVVTATIDAEQSQASADDMNAFLNCCLRKNDLLFRVDDCRWALALPEPVSELDAYALRIQQGWKDANRNRPHGPLPSVELRTVGTWRPTINEQAIIDCLQQVMAPLEIVAL
jgi:anti-sigma regulatory factor (Ser/Thr protein kinase)